MPAFAFSFDDIPPQEQNFIPVCGIFPQLGSIGGEGMHLRWTLPNAYAIPEKITVLRRKSNPKATTIFLRPADSRAANLPANISDVSFAYPGSTRFTLASPTQGAAYENTVQSTTDKLRITFDTAVDFCRIQLGIINPITINGYYADGTVAGRVVVSSTQTYTSYTIAGDGIRKIKYIDLPLNFRYLFSLEYLHHQFLCEQKDWSKVALIDNDADIYSATSEEAVYKRITSDTFNYYLPTTNPTSTKRAQYKEQALRFKNIIMGIRDPQPANFIVQEPYTSLSDIPPNELIFKNKSRARVKALSFLMMHSLDPNIARMLGLYYVDTHAKEIQETVFDYKIVAEYSKIGKTICGVVQQLGKTPAAKPKLPNDFSAMQTSSTRWFFDTALKPEKQLGKVRLTWSAPNAPAQVYTEPVTYGLKRSSNAERLVSPLLGKNKRSLAFVDQGAPVATMNSSGVVNAPEITYELRGIDLFGQVSDNVSKNIKLKDRDIPPPPYKLCFTGVDDNIRLQFEFGASQYLVAPDAKTFTIYKKEDSLVTSREYSYSYDNNFTQDAGGNKIHTLALQGYNSADGEYQFVRFVKTQAGQPLPAAMRKKFRIDNISSGQLRFTAEIDYDPPLNGWVECVKDPLKKSGNGWKSESTVAYSKPLYANLVDYTHFKTDTDAPTKLGTSAIPTNKSFGCKAVMVQSVLGRNIRELFADSGDIKDEDKLTEVLIDRHLFVSGLFTKCRIQGESSTAVILQSSGIPCPPSSEADIQRNPKLKHKYARILIKAEKAIAKGTEIYLGIEAVAGKNEYSNNVFGWIVAQISNSSVPADALQGELLLASKRNVHIDAENIVTDTIEDNLIVATSGSDFRQRGSSTEVLIFVSKKVRELVLGPVVYFRPYRVDIKTIVNGFNLSGTEAHRSIYFCVDTTDSASPANTGSLSSVAQFIKTRNPNDKPDRPPQAPFPCGQATATETYLNPSNAEGRSTFCIEWADIKDAQNVSKGYRYEVARALDKTIIAVHKDLWLKGRDFTDPDNTPKTISGLTLVSTNATTGLITARFTNSENIDWKSYIGGRLKQDSGNSRKSFELIDIKKNGTQVTLTLRAMVKTVSISSGSGSIDQLPNYRLIHEDPAKLNAIIDSCPTAFSIVTRQPLRNATTYLDTVPGTGSSRFFYKVRSVDASELRSEWSPASVAVWQVDTTPPESLRNFTLEADDRQAKLQWSNTGLPLGIKSFDIFRLEEPVAENTDWLTAMPYKTVSRDEIRKKRLVAKARNISLPSAVKVPLVAGTGALPERINNTLASLAISITTIDNPANLYDPLKFDLEYETADNDSALVIRRIKAKEENLVPENKALTIAIGTVMIDGDPSWLEYIDTGIAGGKAYYYSLRPVKKVYIRNGTGELTQYSIKGNPTDVVKLVGIDRSVPEAALLTVVWANSSGTTLTSFSLGAKAKITIDLQGKPATQILIQRNEFLNNDWNSVKIGSQFGWIDVADNLSFFDAAAADFPSVQYRAYYKTADNRISIVSAAIGLSR